MLLMRSTPCHVPIQTKDERVSSALLFHVLSTWISDTYILCILKPLSKKVACVVRADCHDTVE